MKRSLTDGNKQNGKEIKIKSIYENKENKNEMKIKQVSL